MTAGIGGVPAIGAAIAPHGPKSAATRSFLPAAANDTHQSKPAQPDRLRLPEERAFEVSTINARLAVLAAQAEEPPQGGIDIKV